MQRKYLTKNYLGIANELYGKYPLFGITTDVIVGFPGETRKEFRETCEFVEKVGFLKVHIFRYSKREGTEASFMKNQVLEEVKKERAKILADICLKVRQKFYRKMLGKDISVLFEECKNGFWEGFASNYMRVKLKSKEDLSNVVKKVRISKRNLVI
jgi:threonylcarbamoyladenosine tRNA methylthiotransferase MtaB